MAKEKPHWHWPVAWRAEGKAFEFAKNKVVDLFAAGTRRKGRVGLKRLVPSAPIGVGSGTTGVRAEAAIALPVRNGTYRPSESIAVPSATGRL